MVKKCEVAIIGGGPAGSTCAFELTNNDVDVILFDNSHPREKPCAGGIPARFLKEFPLPENVNYKKINYAILTDQFNKKIEIPNKFGGFTIMRRDFDSSLLKKAKRAGTKHVKKMVISIRRIDANWIIKTKDKVYKSKIVIVADGTQSIVRKYILDPIPKEFLAHCVGFHIPCSNIKKEFISDKIELHFLGRNHLNKGYLWIFPKNDFITVGCLDTLGKPVKKNFDLLMKILPFEIKVDDENIKHSHLLPLVFSEKFFKLPTSGKTWAIIGDAAGHVNPITGEGIFYAMMGGKLTARAYLKGDLTLYEKYWRKEFGGDLVWGARLQNLIYNPFIFTQLIRIAKRSKSMENILADIVAGRLPYNTIFKKKIILSSPKIFFQLIKSLLINQK